MHSKVVVVAVIAVCVAFGVAVNIDVGIELLLELRRFHKHVPCLSKHSLLGWSWHSRLLSLPSCQLVLLLLLGLLKHCC
jgi:hypothetical protein